MDRWHMINGCVYRPGWHTFQQNGTPGGRYRKFSHHTFNYHYEAKTNVFVRWQPVHTLGVWCECGTSPCAVIISFNGAWKILWKYFRTHCSCSLPPLLCSILKWPFIWMLTSLRRLEGSDLPAAACRDFFINMATALQQMTGDFRTASPGLCGDHYSGDEWHVLTL